MDNALLTDIDAAQTLAARLQLPYTLTTGKATGTFLAAMAERVLLGTRCNDCQRVASPARDWCGDCRSESYEFVQMPETGTVTAVTTVGDRTIAMICLDGSDTALVHHILAHGAVSIGDRVAAVWAAEPSRTILSVEGFAAIADSAVGTVSAAGNFEPIDQVDYSLQLDYQHAYGPHYGRLFDELATHRRILGSKCPHCHNVLVPPREFCDVCFVRTAGHVDVADTGRLQAFSVIHMEFVGQTRKPPYVYAEVVLDGSATRLIHTVAGFDVATAAERLTIGMPVRAVWRDAAECKGTLDDIEYFQPASDE